MESYAIEHYRNGQWRSVYIVDAPDHNAAIAAFLTMVQSVGGALPISVRASILN